MNQIAREIGYYGHRKFAHHSGKKEFAKGKISENDISVFE